MSERGPLGSRKLPKKLAHVLFWTALFYGLAVAVAKLSEWLDAAG
jgi:hypothetical protein